MIKFGEFAIDADEYCYQAGYLKTRTAKKQDGTEVEQEYVSKPIYATTLLSALQGILRREQRVLISNTDLDLTAAVQSLQELQSRFECYLSEIKEEM